MCCVLKKDMDFRDGKCAQIELTEGSPKAPFHLLMAHKKPIYGKEVELRITKDFCTNPISKQRRRERPIAKSNQQLLGITSAAASDIAKTIV